MFGLFFWNLKYKDGILVLCRKFYFDKITIIEIKSIIPVGPHKAVAEVSRIGHL